MILLVISKFHQRIIELSEVEKLTINAQDYNGLRHFSLMYTVYPSISNGFNNTLCVKLFSKEIIQLNFEQKYERQLGKINKDVLIQYHKAGVLSLMNLLEILEIEDYNEIQEFKKSISHTVFK